MEQKETTEKESTEKKATPSKDYLETVGKLVIPASVACYILGFLVAMPHFAHAGVPISAVAAHTFLASGVLFVVVAAAWGFGVLIVNKFVLHSPRDWASLSLLILPFGLMIFLASPDWRPAVFVVLGSVLFAGVPSAFRPHRFSVKRDQLREAMKGSLLVVMTALSPIGMFGVFLYPLIPAQFGGGRPTVLVAYPRGAASALAAHDQWAARLSCRWRAGEPQELSSTGCRTIYRVHDSEEYLFVAIMEDESPCPARPHRWKDWGLLMSRFPGCFQRIANAEVKQLEMGGHPNEIAP